MDILHGEKNGSHLHLNPDGIKHSMNHADAAESCLTPTTSAARFVCVRVCVCGEGVSFVAGPVCVCLSTGARPMFLFSLPVTTTVRL